MSLPAVVIRPRRVRPGDTVAVVSPSFPAVALWPHRVERGISYLENLGLKVKLMPNAARSDGWVSAPPQERADDLHAAFSDPDVAVVIAGIGGNHSNQVLPHLDFDLIRANPKIFQGYSDMTVLHWAMLERAGLGGFHGPALITQLAEYPEVFEYTDRYLRAAWFGEEPIRYEAAEAWTEEELDWNTKADLERARRMEPSEGWVTVRPGQAGGPLIGGCLETICWHLKGSRFWPDFGGAIFLFETSEEAPSPEHVDAYLTDLAQLGLFDQIAGLVVGRPMGYSKDDAEVLWSIAAAHTEKSGIPVLANVDCGHTHPQLTLPLGAPILLDASEKFLATLEAPTTPA